MELYRITNEDRNGLETVSKEIFLSLFGNETENHYAKLLYREEITPEDVPEEIRERVSTFVNNRIARWGEYEKHEVPPNELKKMLEGII